MIKFSFYSVLYLLLTASSIFSQKCDIMNVKTVLWKPSDTDRMCWSRTDELLLYSRRVAQDLLPTKVPSDLGQLLQYFEIVWQAASKISTSFSSSKEIVRPTIGDAIGGYLQSIAMPLATESYYAGNLDYKIIKGLSDLLTNIKVYLDTDGGGWAAPCNLARIATKVRPYDYRSYPNNPDPLSCLKLHVPLEEDCTEGSDAMRFTLDTKVQLPVLDDPSNPMAMIVPFCGDHLFSIVSASSVSVLERYYDLVMRCIGKKDKETLLNFNAAFQKWLQAHIVPNIQSFKPCESGFQWYPGFGGVIRIIDTMQENGLRLEDSTEEYKTSLVPKGNNDLNTEKVKPQVKPNKISPPIAGSSSSSSSSSGPSWFSKLHLPHFSGPNNHIPILLLPLLLPLAGCMLLYLIYLLYMQCCLPLLCGTQSECNTGKTPLLSFYYRCLANLKRSSTTSNDIPDYDSIRPVSGSSRKSPYTSSCRLCKFTAKKLRSDGLLKFGRKKKKRNAVGSVS